MSEARFKLPKRGYRTVGVERDDLRTWPSLMACVEDICGKRDKAEHERLRRACANDTYWRGHMWERLDVVND